MGSEMCIRDRNIGASGIETSEIVTLLRLMKTRNPNLTDLSPSKLKLDSMCITEAFELPLMRLDL